MITSQLAVRSELPQPARKPYWITSTGIKMKMCNMETSHLFFTFRMLYDGCAKKYDWPVFRKYRGLNINKDWSELFICTSMCQLYQELKTRNDLKQIWQEELEAMIRNLTFVESPRHIQQLAAAGTNLIESSSN